nr:hypothetical protein GCM10020092_060460 [Actinoplanes digitatis]
MFAVVAAGLMVSAPTAEASTASPKVTWGNCPQYSDEVLEAMGLRPDELGRMRALLARTDCGTVRVPLDYRRPNGTRITIAISRIRATDQRHKLGSIAVNPGGPGGSGYLMPHDLALTSPQFGALADRYDLIGFDPRGVGYSTRADCARPDDDVRPPEIPPGPIAEETAAKIYDFQSAANRTCWESNRALLGQLTTANVARDLERVRAALGQGRLSYFGVSWGTLLGQVYRSLYPRSVDRMWLDSVVGPTANRLDSRFHDVTGADERKVYRWAAWAAERDATYHLGDTVDEVVALVKRLKARLNEEPLVFADLDEHLDGNLVAFLVVAPSPLWSEATPGLAALATARSGDPVPDALRPIIMPDPREPTEPLGRAAGAVQRGRRPGHPLQRRHQPARLPHLLADVPGLAAGVPDHREPGQLHPALRRLADPVAGAVHAAQVERIVAAVGAPLGEPDAVRVDRPGAGEDRRHGVHGRGRHPRLGREGPGVHRAPVGVLPDRPPGRRRLHRRDAARHDRRNALGRHG